MYSCLFVSLSLQFFWFKVTFSLLFIFTRIFSFFVCLNFCSFGRVGLIGHCIGGEGKRGWLHWISTFALISLLHTHKKITSTSALYHEFLSVKANHLFFFVRFFDSFFSEDVDRDVKLYLLIRPLKSLVIKRMRLFFQLETLPSSESSLPNN